MALDLISALGALGQMLPGYIQGERMAMQDNWNDANQYNTVQAGQMKNALFAETFPDQVEAARMNALMLGQQYDTNSMQLGLSRVQYPGLLEAARVQSSFAPTLAATTNAMQLGQAQYAVQHPGVLWGAYTGGLGGYGRGGYAGGVQPGLYQYIQQLEAEVAALRGANAQPSAAQ